LPTAPLDIENQYQVAQAPWVVSSSLQDVPRHTPVTIERVDGARSFRRRLIEMGLVPGTAVTVVNVAPLGDPLEIEVRHSRISIRKNEAALIQVTR
jgi:ferrous iron transport protein A